MKDTNKELRIQKTMKESRKEGWKEIRKEGGEEDGKVQIWIDEWMNAGETKH